MVWIHIIHYTCNVVCSIFYNLCTSAVVSFVHCVFLLVTSDKGGGTSFCSCLSVCLSVSKITQNVWMDLDEMLHVDRCRDMDWTN